MKIGDPGHGEFLHYNYSLEPTRSEALWGAPASRKVQTRPRCGQRLQGSVNTIASWNEAKGRASTKEDVTPLPPDLREVRQTKN